MPERRTKSRRPSSSRRSQSRNGSRPARRTSGSAAASAATRNKWRILFLDLDGTLTDGVITFDSQGDQRHFWIRDGLALQWARDLGVLPVVISGRTSPAAELRMRDLDLEYYFGIGDKVEVAGRILQREGASWEECVMVGDDLPDVPLLKRVGWAVAVADAIPEVKALADYVTRARPGEGAVREVVERILRHNGVWRQVLERYEAV